MTSAAEVSALPSATYAGLLRIGSLSCAVHAGRPEDATLVAGMFKQSLDVGQPPAASAGVLEIADAEAPLRSPVPVDGIVLTRERGGLTIASEVLTASFRRHGGAWRALLAIHSRPDTLVLRTHAQVAVHRILLELGAAYLHAGAVTIGGRTFVFVGEKGAGKSSIAVMLGRSGGTILSDDHVLISAGDPAYTVSGCETFARVTAETEAAAFGRPLSLPAADYAGTLKKEFVVGEHFESRPHVDAPIDAVFFPRVGTSLSVSRRSGRALAIDLIQRTRGSYRPQDAGDVRALLDFWTGLSNAAPAFDLELSPDVGHLTRLPALLDGCLLPS